MKVLNFSGEKTSLDERIWNESKGFKVRQKHKIILHQIHNIQCHLGEVR